MQIKPFKLRLHPLLNGAFTQFRLYGTVPTPLPPNELKRLFRQLWSWTIRRLVVAAASKSRLSITSRVFSRYSAEIPTSTHAYVRPTRTGKCSYNPPQRLSSSLGQPGR